MNLSYILTVTPLKMPTLSPGGMHLQSQLLGKLRQGGSFESGGWGQLEQYCKTHLQKLSGRQDKPRRHRRCLHMESEHYPVPLDSKLRRAGKRGRQVYHNAFVSTRGSLSVTSSLSAPHSQTETQRPFPSFRLGTLCCPHPCRAQIWSLSELLSYRCIENYTGARCEEVFLPSASIQSRSNLSAAFVALAILVTLAIAALCLLCR